MLSVQDLVTIGAALGIGKLASAALDGMARQPEVAGNIQTAMIIAAALIEGFTFFALCSSACNKIRSVAKVISLVVACLNRIKLRHMRCLFDILMYCCALVGCLSLVVVFAAEAEKSDDDAWRETM